jgi:hypothetical protein
MRLYQGEDVLEAFENYTENSVCRVSSAQLTAHWFFVDENEIDIETHCYLEMVKLAFQP